jgi:hypothetical protein
MTWASVDAWVSTLPTLVSLASKSRSVPPTLKRSSTATRDTPPDTRGYWLEVLSGAPRAPFALNGAYRERIKGNLLVFYKDDIELQAQQNLIIADYRAIIKVLSNPANWARTTSTIVTLLLGEPNFPFVIEQLDSGKLLTIELTVEHEVTP